MKLFVLLTMAAFYSVSATAQQDIFKKKPWEEYKLKKLLQDSLSRINPVPFLKSEQIKKEIPGVAQVPLKGTLVGKNINGDEIYSMNIDNMACLVPGKDFFSKMPVAGFSMENKSLLPSLLQKQPTFVHSEGGTKAK